MKKNILLFFSEIIACGLFTFAGSVLGHAFGPRSLSLCAITGGVSGIVLTTLILNKTGVVRNNRLSFVIGWGIGSFLLASILAVTNLSSPVIPLLSILLVGGG
jgi:hypothetical protein